MLPSMGSQTVGHDLVIKQQQHHQQKSSVNTRAHKHTHTRTRTRTHARTHTHAHAHTHTRTHTHVHAHAHAHAHTHTQMHTHTYTHLCQRDSQVQREIKCNRGHIKLYLDPLKNFQSVLWGQFHWLFHESCLGAGPAEWLLL